MASVGAAHHVSEGHKNNQVTSDTNQELLEPCLGIIHILEGCEVVDEADAEAKLEALVVRCATWYDFTLEDQADDFLPITLKRLFDGVCEKWIQKKGWLRCVRDTEHEGGGRATEGRDATCSTCSEEDDGEYARPGLLLNVLQLLRLFTRDPRYRTRLVRAGTSLQRIARFLRLRSRAHFEERWLAPGGHGSASAATPLGREMLVECVSIVRRLATDEERCGALFPEGLAGDGEHGIVGTLALLLHTTDNAILPLAIDSLTHIAGRMGEEIERGTERSGKLVDALAHVTTRSLEVILKMVESYSRPFDRLAALLLKTLLSSSQVRERVLVDEHSKRGSGLGGRRPVGGALLVQRLVSRLSYCDAGLFVPVLDALSVALRENFLISDLRDVGGIPILLNVLRADARPPRESSPAAVDFSEGREKALERHARQMELVCALSRCVQAVSVDDEASYQVKQCNGVYLLGRCLVQPWDPADPEFFDNSSTPAAPLLDQGRVSQARAHVLRALRFVFSSERNRDIFKKLLPPDLFSAFIDVGHYQGSLKPYLRLADLVRDPPPTEGESPDRGAGGQGGARPCAEWTRVALKEIDKTAKDETVKVVNGYRFVELLGKGAFGSVYRATKKGFSAHEERTCAVKELALEDVHIFGATKQEQDEAKAAIAEEMKILSEMDHPGIVRYYESFESKGKVYIAMEYAGGMSLDDRIRSLVARNQRCSEREVWQILTQLCLALRYMHQDKGIVHRDLTPANIIISLGNDIVPPDELSSDQPLTVKITDFGYAKRKEEGGFVMRSLVGTITFCCPEIVQHQVYTDKADVWSLGCILYNVMLLRPPFAASNIFNIAQKIVEGKFDPEITSREEVPWYSDELKGLVGRMLTTSAEERPSIGDVMVEISSRVAREADVMRGKIRLLEQEIHMERKYFVREKRIAMKTRNALDRANSASSISSIAGLEDGYGGSMGGASEWPVGVGDLESPKIAPGHHHHVATKAPLGLAKTLKQGETLTKTKISIPQRNLRVLTDPVVDMLTQVHKLTLVSQLPPSLDLHSDERRQFLQRVHHHLFASDQRAGSIKAHLAKLVEGSEEPVEGLGLSIGKHESVSYAHVSGVLEEVLRETGYYLEHDNRQTA